MTLQPGLKLGPYQIAGLLGAGGMGQVYRAVDTRLGRTVAIKVLPSHVESHPALRQRFEREARTLASLSHPNICPVFDVGSQDGTDFLVMEYLEGRTLAEHLDAGALPLDQAHRFAIAIADGMVRAHSAGILHRDLKPSNVMVTSDGQIKILDFGLARNMEPLDVSHVTTAAALTHDGMVVGTASYMSPEQADGRKLDARSDVFSFGSVLYEMVTGRRAFTADSPLGTLVKVLNEGPVPPSRLIPLIPPQLERTILRCLQKSPGQRYQTMADLRDSLDDLDLASPSVTRRWADRITRDWQWTAAVLASIVLLAGAWAVTRWRQVTPTEPLRAMALTTLPGQELYPSLSPDGNYVAFTWTGPRQDNTDIYVQQIGVGAPLRITTDALVDDNPAWSPDGRWIAFLRGNRAAPLASSERELRLIPPLGGAERRLGTVRPLEITINPLYLTWCPDSTCLIVTDATGDAMPDALYVVSVETGEKRRLTDPRPPVLADTSPSVSPDGQSLIFLRRSTWAVGDLYQLPLGPGITARGEPTLRAVAGRKPDNAVWIPGADEVLLSPGAVAGAASLWRLDSSGNAPPVRLPFVGEDGVMPSVSRPQTGRALRLVYVRSFTDENIWRVDISNPGAQASAAPAVAVASTRADIHPLISPDGRRLAFTSTRSENWEIWVADLDGANAVQLTSLRAAATGVPRWSPDGQSIAFASDTEGQFEIFVVSAAGGRPRRLTNHPALDHVPSFSRDGQWVYFSSNRTGQYQVWKAPARGGEPVQVTTDGGWTSFESVDGRDLYFTPRAAVGAPTALRRMPTSGGPSSQVLDGVLNHSFAVIDRGLYYIDQSSGRARLRYYDLSRRRSVTVVENLGTGPQLGGPSASRDGRTVLFSRLDSSVDDLMLVDNFR